MVCWSLFVSILRGVGLVIAVAGDSFPGFLMVWGVGFLVVCWLGMFFRVLGSCWVLWVGSVGVVLISNLRLPACVDARDFLVLELLLVVSGFLMFGFCGFGGMLLLGIWLRVVGWFWMGLGFRVNVGGVEWCVGDLVIWLSWFGLRCADFAVCRNVFFRVCLLVGWVWVALVVAGASV